MGGCSRFYTQVGNFNLNGGIGGCSRFYTHMGKSITKFFLSALASSKIYTS